MYKQAPKCFNLLLDRGASIDARFANTDRSVACLAAGMAGSTYIQAIVDHKLDLNRFRSRTGQTALFSAIANDRLANLKIMLRGGASTAIEDTIGGPPLLYAAKIGRTDMVLALLDGGADPTARDGMYMSLGIIIKKFYAEPGTSNYERVRVFKEELKRRGVSLE